jgi:hypothetical protein
MCGALKFKVFLALANDVCHVWFTYPILEVTQVSGDRGWLYRLYPTK